MRTSPSRILTTFLVVILSTGRAVQGFATPQFNRRGTITQAFATKKDQHHHAVSNNKSLLNPTPVLYKYAKPLMLALVLSSTALDANAAMSGGRMGGSFSAPARISAPSYSGGGRGYSGGGYGGGGGYRGGGYGGTAYYGGGAALVAPPVYYGGGAGVMTVSRGFSPLDVLFLGGFGFLFVSSFLRGNDQETMAISSALGEGVSVARLSVALEVPNRDERGSLLSVLAQTAQTANTDSRRGVQQLTSQVALEVLRRKSSIISGSSSYQYFKDVPQAERTFNQWSVDERSKYEKENTNRFGSMDRSLKGERAVTNDSRATMAVVTFVLSIQGDSTKIPKIRSMADVEEALLRVASDSKVDDCLLSAEILWTPEDRNEVLTRRDVVADYPGLIDV